MEERFQFVINFVNESTGYDCTYYLKKVFTLDVTKACEWLREQQDSFYRDILLYQLERYKDLLDKD